MRLSGFLIQHIESIVQEWENFASTLYTTGKPLDSEALRDHAELMLRTIAADLDTDQTPVQQKTKSHGQGPATEGSAAQSHAMTRLMSGFSIDQVVSEFRALRASVVSQWMKQVRTGMPFEVDDMIRFNEAIDQALAESISSYTHEVQASRNIFLGILGHDLRTPLNAILLGADVLLRTDTLGARATKTASRIYASVKRATHIVADLLDFTRSQLGPGIPVKRTRVDLGPVCARIVDESRMVYPEASIVMAAPGQIEGDFDASRLEQVFSNLITNAVQHGNRNTPITVTLDATQSTLRFSVHNTGSVIPDDVLPFIFNPMGRYSPQSSADNGPYASLGLGLFIVAEVVEAHDGHIEVSSTAESGTSFTVSIPLNNSAS
jgi:signal transduction histidine kinase